MSDENKIDPADGWPIPRFDRSIIDDGRDPDPWTGLPLETDSELRARIKASLASEAPPPPCATCDGTCHLLIHELPCLGCCPDCTGGSR